MRGPLLVLLETDDFARELYTDYLVARGFRVRAETLFDDALGALKKGAPVLIAGINPGMSVAELAAQMRRASPAAALLVILPRSASGGPLRALREGALEALMAPVSGDALALGVVHCLESVSLLQRMPEMRRHVELYHATLRLHRAPDVPALGSELLNAAAARVPLDGGVIISGPDKTGGFDLVAMRDIPEDVLRDLLSAWDLEALANGTALAEGVLSFPSSGPFARAKGKAARLAGHTIVLPLGLVGGGGQMCAALFLAKPKKEPRPEDPQLGPDLALLRAQAVAALEAVHKYPDGAAEGSIDPETNLFDERFLLRTLDHEVQRRKRTGEGNAALLVMDVYGVEEASATHGTVVAARLFAEASRLLLRSVRELDVVARTGPSQFSVLLMGTDVQGARGTAERLSRSVLGHRFLTREGLSLGVDVSVGVAAYPDHGETAEAVRAAAAEAAGSRRAPVVMATPNEL